MPTLAQLQSEPYWSREIVTAELDWLGDELCRRTGRPRDAAGTKGDTHHLNGAHRSQEWILNSRWCTSRTYTVQSGLTATQLRHIAGFDFTPGTVAQMIAQCKRLMSAMKAGILEEVRELYGNVDGDKVVDGWDNLHNRAATSDSSHLWHWHLSIDRKHLTNKALMERIVAIALGEDIDVDTKEQIANSLQFGWATLTGQPAAVYPNEAPGSARVNVGNPLWGQLETTGAAVSEVAAKVDAGVAQILARPQVEAAPVDPAALKAVLLDPQVLAAIAGAVLDAQAARLAE